MTALLSRWQSWRCEAGHHGAGRKVPKACPLVFCGRPCEGYGPRRAG